MAWLAQNWIFLAAAVGVVFLMSRGGGCCGGHHHNHGKPGAGPAADRGSGHSGV